MQGAGLGTGVLACFALVLTVLAVVMAGFPAGVGVVFLLLGVVAAVLIHRITRPTEALTYSATEAPGYWQDWLAGWYWQTDLQHRLVVLKPDAQAGEWAWQEAQRLCRAATVLPTLWAASPGAAALLETRLNARLPLDVAGLPAWPARDLVEDGQTPVAGEGGEGAHPAPPRAIPIPAADRCWHLQGVPRFDANGAFIGYHGVLCPERTALPATTADTAVPPDAATAHPLPAGMASTPHADAPDPAAADLPPPMTEAEQEVLRYALSHDLRAPLRVVDGFARILKEDYARTLDRIGNDHLDRVLAAAARMNGMIDAILAQAQLSQTPIERRDVDLSAMAREIAEEQCMATLLPDGRRVKVVVADGLHTQADPVLLRRVLDNLISNALKYSGKVEHAQIEVGTVPATDPCVYFVRDNGAGFDMQHADKLFGLFQRLHSHKDFPGTGVGLAGVQNIIRRHGGRVWAEAAPGQGACFYFTLTPAHAQQTLRAGGGGASVQGPQA